MTRALLFIVKLAVLVAVAVWLANRPGVVEIDWLGRRIETSVGVLALGVALLMAVAALIYRGWRLVARAPRSIGRVREGTRRDRGYRALTRGMVAVAAGDADAARRFAREADGLLDEPPLTMLLSAQAAQLNGDEGAARRYFEAMLKRPETEFLGLRGLLNTALKRNDRAEALALVERARVISPRTPWVLRACLELQVAQRRWPEAEATLAEALKAGVWDAETGRRFRTAILVEASRMAEADGRPGDASTMAHKAVGLMPGFVPAIAREARLLIRAGRHKQAARLIEKSWPRSPHAELAQIFRESEPATADPLAAVRQMERLLHLAPEHPESLLAMAEAELRARLWGAARTHLLKAAEAAPERRIFRLLAELETAEHDDGVAARGWLAKAAAAPPDPVWACASCGAPAPIWSALCPACDAFDTLSWRPPTAAIHLPAATAVLHPAAEARLPAVR